MSDLDLRTRQLLRAAREDGGSAAARARIWAELGGVTGAGAAGAAGGGGVAGGGSAMGSASAAGGVASKLVVLLGAIGVVCATSAGAVALAGGARAEPIPRRVSVRTPTALAGEAPHPSEGAMYSMIERAPRALVYVDADRRARHAVRASTPRAASEASHAIEARVTPESSPGLEASRGPELQGAQAASSAGPPARAGGPDGAADSDMTREATLLADARAALRRGEAGAALEHLAAAQSLRHRALVPEEMSLRVKAMRLAGDARADEVERDLRAKYPGHALAR